MDSDGNQMDEEQSNWLEVKRHRNRVNSQKTRNREREQIDQLQSQKTSLYLANTALQYQNQHMRDAIQQVRNIMMCKNSTLPAPPHTGIASVGAQRTILPPQAVPTAPVVVPPQQQALQQQIFQQILANARALQQPQVSVAPTNAHQIAAALQNEVARNPLLSSAMNAGLLQFSTPGGAQQQGAHVQHSQVALQNAITLPAVQHAMNELARNSATTGTSMQGAQVTASGQQHQPNEQTGNP